MNTGLNTTTAEVRISDNDSTLQEQLPQLLLLLAIVLAVVAYIGTLRFQFVYDDVPQILGNSRITAWHFLPSYFTQHVWAHLTPNNPGNYYRPVFLIWMLVNFKLFGLHPMGWHAAVLLVHAAVTWLVFLVVAHDLKDRVTAGFAALIFALHPIHVEGVAWVSGVTEPLMALLFIGALLAFLRWREGRGSVWFAASLVMFALSALVKETAIVLPALIFVYEWSRSGVEVEMSDANAASANETVTAKFRRALLTSVPYGLTALAYLAVRAVVLKGIMPLEGNHVSISHVILTWPSILWFYCSKLVWPWPLGPFYPLNFVVQAGLSDLVLPALGVVAVAAGLLLWSRRSREVTIACAWLIIPILPAVVGTARLERGELVHDRYLYVPSIGLAMLVALALRRLRLGEKKLFGLPAMQAAAILAIVCALGALTARQSAYWTNDLILYSHGVNMAPNSMLANAHMANELSKRGQKDAALVLYRRAVESDPDDWRGQFAFGLTLTDMRYWPEAEEHLARAVRLNPTEPSAWFVLGTVQGTRDEFPEAEASLRRALALWSSVPPRYHFALATVLEKQGKLAEAVSEYRAEVAAAPLSADAAEKVVELQRTLQSTR